MMHYVLPAAEALINGHIPASDVLLDDDVNTCFNMSDFNGSSMNQV